MYSRDSLIIGLTVLCSASIAMAQSQSNHVIVELETSAVSGSNISIVQNTIIGELSGAEFELQHAYQWLPFMALRLGPGARAVLNQSDMVANIYEDHIAYPTLDFSVPAIGGDIVHDLGITGIGQTIAILDTGVDTNHPAFSGRIVAEACFTHGGGCPNGEDVMIGPGAGVPCTFDQGCFHGTHVAGIATSSESAPGPGVAPDAGIVAINVFSNNSGNLSGFFSDIIAAIDHLLDLPELQIRAANLSLGTGPFAFPCDAAFPAMRAIVQDAKQGGITVVVSSGNNTSLNGLSAPACLTNTLSVGCTNNQDVVCGFSNSGPGLDLLAPGSLITSAAQGGGHRTASGTSMSSPHVTGSIALLYQFKDDLTPDAVKLTLKDSGEPVQDSRNGRTSARIQLDRAINSLDVNQECGDGSRTGSEQCDVPDDSACPGLCLPNCSCCIQERPECEICPECPNCPLCPLCPICPVTPCPPFCTDSDKDGEANDNDKCPFTPPGEEVDDSGCSQQEFCAKMEVRTNRRAAKACKRMDWKNDEPLASKPFDCFHDRNGTNSDRRDDACRAIE